MGPGCRCASQHQLPYLANFKRDECRSLAMHGAQRKRVQDPCPTPRTDSCLMGVPAPRGPEMALPCTVKQMGPRDFSHELQLVLDIVDAQ